MDHPKFPEALRVSLDALMKDLQDIAYEEVRDAYPGRLAPTHTSRYDTAADRKAAHTRIIDTLTALALAADITSAERDAFRAAITAAVAAYHRHTTIGFRASIGIHSSGGPLSLYHRGRTRAQSLNNVSRAAADIGTLVVLPSSAPLLDALDAVEDALTGGASVERLATVLDRLRALFHLHEDRMGKHFGTYMAHAHHYALLMAGALDQYADDFRHVCRGLVAARADLADHYVNGTQYVARAPETEPEPEHTGPVTLVVGTAHTTDEERQRRGYGNSLTRYKTLDSPSAGDFPTIESARNVAVDILETKGATADEVAAARTLPFGRGLTAAGLHILIRETN